MALRWRFGSESLPPLRGGGTFAFALEECVGAEQPEIVPSGVITNLLMNVVATVRRSIFDASGDTGRSQQAVGIGVLGVEAGDVELAFGAVLGDHASTQCLPMTVDVGDLVDGEKTEGLPSGIKDPKAPQLQADVFLIQRAGLWGISLPSNCMALATAVG